MPALTTIALATTAAIGGAQAIGGAVKTKRAKEALKNFKRQELKNVADELRVSTLGADLQTEEGQRRFSTSVDALRSAGVRGLIGGLGQQELMQQRMQAQIAAGLDMQQVEIDRLRAEDEVRIRGMMETRDEQAIAGLSEELAYGRQMTQAGLQNLMQTGGAALKYGMAQEGLGPWQGLPEGGGGGGGSIDLSALSSAAQQVTPQSAQQQDALVRKTAANEFGGGAQMPNVSAQAMQGSSLSGLGINNRGIGPSGYNAFNKSMGLKGDAYGEQGSFTYDYGFRPE